MVYEYFDFDVCCGEIFGVVGGFGIGKLVLLCSIVGLCWLIFGSVWVFGEDLL